LSFVVTPSIRQREASAGVVVRRGRRADTSAVALVVDSARFEFGALAGSRDRAAGLLTALWPHVGHSFSWEHAWVAELDGQVVGVLVGFAESDRLRLHAGLAARSVRHLPVGRVLLLPVVLALLRVLAPRPPREAFYIAAIAVAPHARRRGVASALGEAAVGHARATGFGRIAAHTGTHHLAARRGLERFGLSASRARQRGYVLYTATLDLPDGPEAPGKG